MKVNLVLLTAYFLEATGQTSVPTPFPQSTNLSTQYLGCYRDTYFDRALNYYVDRTIDLITCARTCSDLGYKYMGRQMWEECWCGNAGTDYSRFGTDRDCACDAAYIGAFVFCAYEITSTQSTPPSLSDSPSSSPVVVPASSVSPSNSSALPELPEFPSRLPSTPPTASVSPFSASPTLPNLSGSPSSSPTPPIPFGVPSSSPTLTQLSRFPSSSPSTSSSPPSNSPFTPHKPSGSPSTPPKPSGSPSTLPEPSGSPSSFSPNLPQPSSFPTISQPTSPELSRFPSSSPSMGFLSSSPSLTSSPTTLPNPPSRFSPPSTSSPTTPTPPPSPFNYPSKSPEIPPPTMPIPPPSSFSPPSSSPVIPPTVSIPSPSPSPSNSTSQSPVIPPPTVPIQPPSPFNPPSRSSPVIPAPTVPIPPPFRSPVRSSPTMPNPPPSPFNPPFGLPVISPPTLPAPTPFPSNVTSASPVISSPAIPNPSPSPFTPPFGSPVISPPFPAPSPFSPPFGSPIISPPISPAPPSVSPKPTSTSFTSSPANTTSPEPFISTVPSNSSAPSQPPLSPSNSSAPSQPPLSPSTSPSSPPPISSPAPSSSQPTSSPPTNTPSNLPTFSPTTKLNLVQITKPLKGKARYDRFGWSVSLSDTGDMVLIGSPGHDAKDISSSGLVQSFVIQNDDDDDDDINWQQFGSDEIGKTKYELAGTSVSLSGDNQYMAMGAPGNRFSTYATGYVTLFKKNEHDATSGWNNRGVIQGDERGDHFGSSIALSRNGTRVAIGGERYARVYEWDDDDWVRMGEDFLGHSIVSLTGNGSIVAIGFPRKGFVQVYGWDANLSNWVQRGSNIARGNLEDDFGTSLSISDKGDRVIVGTYKGNYVTVYEYRVSEWELLGNEIEGDMNDVGNLGSFGNSVSMSDNGDRIVIGSPEYRSGRAKRGRAVVYQLGKEGSLLKIGEDIVGQKDDDQVGHSVSISGDGNYVAVGAYGVDRGHGHVLLYRIV